MAALFWFVVFLICLPVVIGGIVADDLSGLLVPAGLILALLAVRWRKRHRSRRTQELVSRALYHRPDR
jgi:hypothetical protein